MLIRPRVSKLIYFYANTKEQHNLTQQFRYALTRPPIINPYRAQTLAFYTNMQEYQENFKQKKRIK